MPYATEQELENALGEVEMIAAYGDQNTGDEDPGPVAQLLEAASEFVNRYLRRLYVLPLPDPPPPTVKYLTIDIASARAKFRHPEVFKIDGKEIYARAVKELEDLRDGKTVLDAPLLPAPLNAQTVTTGAGRSATGEPLPSFFVKGLGDF